MSLCLAIGVLKRSKEWIELMEMGCIWAVGQVEGQVRRRYIAFVQRTRGYDPDWVRVYCRCDWCGKELLDG